MTKDTQSYLFGVSEFTTWPWTFEQDVETYARLGVGAIKVCEFKLNPDRTEAQMRLPAALGLAITDQAIAACGDHIFVVQVSDWRTPRVTDDRLVPGQGEILLAAFLRAVRATGFDGAYSVEIFSGDMPDSLWKSDLEQVIRDSRTGLDRAWRESWPEEPNKPA